MSRKDIYSAVFFLALAIAVGLQAGGYPKGTLKHVGPGLFPLALAVLLGCLSFTLLLVSWSHRKEKGKPVWPQHKTAIGVIMLALFAYGFFLQLLGFSLTTFLFSLALLKYGYPRAWLFPIGGALATTMIIFLLFKVWLGTPFPTGIIGF